jgi:tripartite-type tricarboxylate transporter receptor subunit TctC
MVRGFFVRDNLETTMKTMMTRRALMQLGIGALALLAGPTWAQSDWPIKPVTLIVPFPAGGGTDAFARPLAAVLSKELGQQFIIDNRGGAGGTVGASAAAKAPADGYTLFVGAVHHSIAPSMYPKLDYSIQKDFIPLAVIARVPQVLVVNPKKVPVKDYQAFLAQVKANPGKMNYGSAGSGTSHHLAGELYKIQAKTDIAHIPYRGAGPAMQGLIAGDVDMMFDGLGSSSAQIKAGRITPLFVASEKRNPAIPNVPTTAEIGLPQYVVSTWYALWAPKNTPAAVTDKIIAALKKLPQDETIRTVWATNGAEFPDLTGAKFGAFVDSEVKRWSDVVKASGAKLD